MNSRRLGQAGKTRGYTEALRSLGIASVCWAAAAFFIYYVNPFYPLKEWLFFRYAVAWLFTSIFLLSSLAGGWRLCRKLLPLSVPLSERLVLSLSLGILLFFGGVFVAGCLNLYGPLFFWLWPALLLAHGAPQCWSDYAEACPPGCKKLNWQKLLPQTKSQMLGAALLLFGIIAVYLQVMTPINLGADCYWYHEPTAEAYVAAGGIRRFNEGWYVGAYPQLATFLYTWAFQAPGALLDHVFLCTHIEFIIFLITLLALSVFAARVVRRSRLPYAAAVIFLFPKLFIYDSNLNGGADHILAFFCTALAISLVRLGRQFRTNEALVAGLITAAALLTKYQAVYVFMPTSILLLVLAIRHRAVRPLLLWGTVACICSAPHWLKNLIYYHDPLYPFLHRYFPSQPFHRGAETLMAQVFWTTRFDVTGSLSDKLVSTLRALATYSFVPNDWGFHGERPEFGSLFTLMIPVLLLLGGTRRLWITVFAVHVGIGLWYFINHQDRYLQCLVPCMASVTAATMALAWRRGWVVKGPLVILVGAQWVWGADALFIPAHTMIGESPFRAFGNYMAMGFRGEYEQRYHFGGSAENFGKLLPKGAKLLMHLYNTHLGLGAEFMTDSPGWQGGIDYLETNSATATAALLRNMGATHVTWPNSRDGMSPSDLARESVFERMNFEYVQHEQIVNGWKLGELGASPRRRDLADAATIIAWLGCDANPRSGLYTPRGLANGFTEHTFADAAAANMSVELSKANVLIVRNGCGAWSSRTDLWNTTFSSVLRAGEHQLWVRH